MNKYIDAEKLKYEIERLKGQLIRGACAAQIEMETNCKDEAYNEILALIDSLQKEQPEVDLEKEIATWIPSHITGGEEGVWKECREAVTKWAGIVARHFYEPGLKARKEE